MSSGALVDFLGLPNWLPVYAQPKAKVHRISFHHDVNAKVTHLWYPTSCVNAILWTTLGDIDCTANLVKLTVMEGMFGGTFDYDCTPSFSR